MVEREESRAQHHLRRRGLERGFRGEGGEVTGFQSA